MLHENDSRDMIKEILQKIIDEMGALESDRIIPEHRRPKAIALETKIAAPISEELDIETDEDINSTVLDELLIKADNADETGLLPEDVTNDLPDEITETIRRKKKRFVDGKEEEPNPNIFKRSG